MVDNLNWNGRITNLGCFDEGELRHPQNKIFIGALICHFSASDHGIVKLANTFISRISTL